VKHAVAAAEAETEAAGEEEEGKEEHTITKTTVGK
jgi:hypothetical protein